jgi:hypothetical protein
MSRQNKVNPGMYTQRGRLTQDDAARELRKQREVGSQHTWQPVKKDQFPRFESKQEKSDEGTETSGDTQGQQATTSSDNVPTKRVMKKTAAKSPAMAKTKAKAKKSTAAKTTAARKPAAKTSSKGKIGKAAKSAAKRTAKKAPKRQAVLARNVGGGGPKPRRATKRRKS